MISLLVLLLRSAREFRVQLVARAIKETLREGINLRWVHTGAQLADALTKAMEARFLRETLKHGSYRLCDENSMLKERAKTRDRIKWLKQQGSNSETILSMIIPPHIQLHLIQPILNKSPFHFPKKRNFGSVIRTFRCPG